MGPKLAVPITAKDLFINGVATMGKKMISAKQQPSWWMSVGPEACESCSRAYYLEMGYHCARCDRAICSICVITVFEVRTALCPGCYGEGVD